MGCGSSTRSSTWNDRYHGTVQFRARKWYFTLDYGTRETEMYIESNEAGSSGKRDSLLMSSQLSRVRSHFLRSPFAWIKRVFDRAGGSLMKSNSRFQESISCGSIFTWTLSELHVSLLADYYLKFEVSLMSLVIFWKVKIFSIGRQYFRLILYVYL